MLNHEQMKAATAAAQRQFGLLRKKYPTLKAHLVLVLSSGQVELDSAPAQILTGLPALVRDDSAKRGVADLLEAKNKLEKSLASLSSPDTDAGLTEFRSTHGARLRALAALQNQAVYQVKEFLKTEVANGKAGDKELVQKLLGVERAETKLRELEAAKKMELAEMVERLNHLATELKYDGACQVEMRFNDLNYELIWQLQADELVNRNLTPQTKASIRIVLGTLAQFAQHQ